MPTDFARDSVADRLTATGLDPGQLSLFLLEGVAVYLEPAVLERILRQFRQVARPGSRLAISVSTASADGQARSRFRASVASLGEPTRSTLDADQATELLARTGWRVTAGDDADDPEAVSRRERRRSAGLLLATAAPAATDPGTVSSPSSRPSRQHQPLQQPTEPLSLSALLSQTLVALTIELDNEAEHRIPHRTTDYGPGDQGDGPWLVSRAMFENCLRFVTDHPITVGMLETLARTPTNLDGMRRWGYITIDATAERVHHGRPGPDAVLRAASRGLRAREIWLELPGLVEQRWRLCTAPTRSRGCAARWPRWPASSIPGCPTSCPFSAIPCSAGDPIPPCRRGGSSRTSPRCRWRRCCSRVLLGFALEYEAESAVSLAVGANLLRVLGADGTRLRDLPLLTGISKEAVSWAMGVLLRARLAVEEPDPAANRGKAARLTASGVHAQQLYLELLGTIEDRWAQHYGRDAGGALRQAAEALAVGADGQPPPLFRALEPYPGNWRASVRRPGTLPYYPMVLHRGGYPDGTAARRGARTR